MPWPTKIFEGHRGHGTPARTRLARELLAVRVLGVGVERAGDLFVEDGQRRQPDDGSQLRARVLREVVRPQEQRLRARGVARGDESVARRRRRPPRAAAAAAAVAGAVERADVRIRRVGEQINECHRVAERERRAVSQRRLRSPKGCVDLRRDFGGIRAAEAVAHPRPRRARDVRPGSRWDTTQQRKEHTARPGRQPNSHHCLSTIQGQRVDDAVS